jgi:glycosyltransferase involved in cell wall biosynthesis
MVSVVLPTHNRRAMLRDAIKSYLHQDWKDKELVVIDDGIDCCRDLFEEMVPNDELNYLYLASPAKNLSVKRNIATQIARGEIIIHFDSDDWSAPTRITHQVNALIESGLEVGGYHSAMFWDEVEKRATRYQGMPDYAWGPTFCYRKEWALKHPWPENVDNAEDGIFYAVARKMKAISPKSALDGTGQMVCRLHRDNARRSVGHHIPKESLPPEFLDLIGERCLVQT